MFFYVKPYLFYFINGQKVGLICKALYKANLTIFFSNLNSLRLKWFLKTEKLTNFEFFYKPWTTQPYYLQIWPWEQHLNSKLPSQQWTLSAHFDLLNNPQLRDLMLRVCWLGDFWDKHQDFGHFLYCRALINPLDFLFGLSLQVQTHVWRIVLHSCKVM